MALWSHHLPNSRKTTSSLSTSRIASNRHPRLFLSDKNDSVALLDRLCPALPIDFFPPTPSRLIFRTASAFRRAIYFTIISPLRAAELYNTSFNPSHLAYSIRGAGSTSSRLNFTSSLCANSQPHTTTSSTAKVLPSLRRGYRVPLCLPCELWRIEEQNHSMFPALTRL
jgi:hypothetical protein